jgi:methionyl-tRNA formyltransferase
MNLPRILFLGMNGVFSRIPFLTLLEAGISPAALVIPPPPGVRVAFRKLRYPPPARGHSTQEKNLLQLAAGAEVPIFEVGNLHDPGALEYVRRLNIDWLVTACFPAILPPAWLSLPQKAPLNLHPSMLPAYRGPAPLFWQFRNGEQNTGISLHRMTEQADAGPLFAQAHVPFPAGIREIEADRLTAAAGAGLLVNLLREPETFQPVPQPLTGASYYGRPEARHRDLDTRWQARRAFNFIRGAREWGNFSIRGPGFTLAVVDALAFDEGVQPGTTPHRTDENHVRVPFADGWLTAQLA